MFKQEQWNDIFGGIEYSQFTKEQLHEIYTGQESDLPSQLYADPSFTPSQMLRLRTMLDTALSALQTPERRIVCTDYGPEELIPGFKSASNFSKYPERVCYVPENWDFDNGPGCTAKDFLTLCEGDPIKASLLFDECDWQHPSTVLDEWDRYRDELRMDEVLAERREKAAQEQAKSIPAIPDLSPALLEQIQSRLRRIADTHSWVHGLKKAPLNTEQKLLVSSLHEARTDLMSFLQGVSFALPGKCNLSYNVTDNIITVETEDYQPTAFITANSYLPNIEYGHPNLVDPIHRTVPASDATIKPGTLEAKITVAQAIHDKRSQRQSETSHQEPER